MNEIHIDALLPAEMAVRAEQIGVRKAEMPALPMFTLAVLAGAFISLGSIFATTVSAGSMITTAPGGQVISSAALPYGITRLLSGLVFCLGLILVVVGGAELFTGNNLIVMAWAGGRVGTGSVLRSWALVYAGNFAGGLGVALAAYGAGLHEAGGGAFGASALGIAAEKLRPGFGQAVVLGVLGNVLVCLAVWLSYSARSTADRILAVVPPIAAFVAAGFEHSVANMYFVPFALLVAHLDPGFVAARGADVHVLTWSAFLVRNLLPVTIGNMLGGAGLVGGVYWFVYLRPRARD